ncbi:MAG: hypothetical protein JSW40_02395 [Candidatus Omnitrophota bacterium]|nr:MAG: hypothetical protein JSW40_02395 [Candidatus Omnitrophota bacterium]
MGRRIGINHKIPVSLKIVGYLFILTGLLPFIVGGISLATTGSCKIGLDLFNVVCVFIGFGILKLRNGWRILGIIILLINLIIYGLFTLLLGCSSLIVTLKEPGADKGILIFTNIFMFIFVIIIIYMLVALLRPNIVKLFKKQ